MPRSASHSVPLALAISLALCCGAARAQTPQDATARTISIAAQPLGDALNAWARLAGVQLAVPQALVAGKTAPAVVGQFTPQQALERLLAGSGLVATREGDAMVVKAAPAPGAASTLAPVTVTASAERETATGPVAGYAARRSASGTKTDTPIIETPQSISVVTAAQIETLKPLTVSEALAYTPGVAYEGLYGSVSDSVLLRGFSSYGAGAYFRDGLKYLTNVFDGQIEPYGLERLEVLKGAASVLYGVAAPGGIVNAVSKRPSADAARELNLAVGSFGSRQVSADFTGPLTADGAWSYRLVALGRDADTFVDHTRNDRRYLATSLKWQPDARTAVTLLADYARSTTTYLAGLPVSGTLLPNPNGRVARSRFIGEPDIDRKDSTNWSLGYLVEKGLADGLTLRHAARYSDVDSTMGMVSLEALGADGRTVGRSAQFRDEGRGIDATTVDTSLEYRWSADRIENTLLAGIDHVNRSFDTRRTYHALGALDLFTPVYGAAPGAFQRARSFRWKERQTGVYLQDQLKIDRRWVLMLGGRQDSARQDFVNQNAPAQVTKADAFTTRAGFVYLADNGLAPFASFSQSFEPTSGANRAGEPFKPTRGEQVELGLRYRPAERLEISAAVYRLTQTNVLKTDPADTNYSVQAGEIRATGLELEARGRATRHLSVIAGYAHTATKTTRNSGVAGDNDFGKPNIGVPRNTVSLWTLFDLAGLGAPGWSLGAGARHVGSARGLSEAGADVSVPGRTVVDAAASYETGHWRFALNVANLFDREYLSSCYWGCYYGEPRRMTGTVGYRW